MCATRDGVKHRLRLSDVGDGTATRKVAVEYRIAHRRASSEGPHRCHTICSTRCRNLRCLGKTGKFYSLPALEKALGAKISRLPVSIRIVLESVLRNCDGKKSPKSTSASSRTGSRTRRAPRNSFVLSRILLQDLTGIPSLADLAAMRSVAQRLGKNPKVVEPLVPSISSSTTPSRSTTTGSRTRSTST